jgi:hypothetical protein
MACGCGGSSNSGADSGGALLSGTLDGGAYAGDAPPADSGIVAGPSIETQFRTRGFWFLVVIFVIGAAWYASDKKRGDS